MAKKKKKPDLSADIVAAYIRKSVMDWPPGCDTIDLRTSYVDNLVRTRTLELVADAARDNETIDHFYIDMGISGQGDFLDDRVQFLAMWASASKGQIRRIYSRDLARLGRNFIQQEQFIDELRNIGVIVRSPEMQDTGKLTEEEIVAHDAARRHIAVSNEMMARFTAAKVRTNHVTMVSSGRWAGRSQSVWGLRYNKETKWFDYDEATAPLAIHVFEEYLKHGTTNQTANTLNAQILAGSPAAIYTPNGKLWHPATVRRIITNPLYRQVITYNDGVLGSTPSRPTLIHILILILAY